MSGTGMPPAVLLGGDSNALSAARALSRLGAPVYAIGGDLSPVRHSRALKRYAALGVGDGSQRRWLDWLLSERVGGVVIPCADDGVELLARHRATLEAAGYVGTESDDTVALAMLDKERTYELARAAGIAVPRTFVPSGPASLEEAAARVGLPCALKPRRTYARMPAGFAAKAFVVHTTEELVHMHAALSARGVETIVTEIVKGPDRALSQYWSYRTSDGRRLLELTKHKLRQHPPGFGTGCLQVIEPDPQLAEAGRRFVELMGVTGFCSVEFKRPPGGELTVIECNYRLIDANELGRAAGVDAARVVYERALGHEVSPQPHPRSGIGFWHPVRDLRSLPEYRRRGEATLVAWARTARPGKVITPYFSWRDPRPSVMVARDRARRVLRSRRAPAPGHAGGAQ